MAEITPLQSCVDAWKRTYPPPSAAGVTDQPGLDALIQYAKGLTVAIRDCYQHDNDGELRKVLGLNQDLIVNPFFKSRFFTGLEPREKVILEEYLPWVISDSSLHRPDWLTEPKVMIQYGFAEKIVKDALAGLQSYLGTSVTLAFSN